VQGPAICSAHLPDRDRRAPLAGYRGPRLARIARQQCACNAASGFSGPPIPNRVIARPFDTHIVVRPDWWGRRVLRPQPAPGTRWIRPIQVTSRSLTFRPLSLYFCGMLAAGQPRWSPNQRASYRPPSGGQCNTGNQGQSLGGHVSVSTVPNTAVRAPVNREAACLSTTVNRRRT